MALELKKPGATFTVKDSDVVVGGDPDTVYTVRYWTQDDADRLRRAATTRRFDPTTREMVEHCDGDALAASILTHVIADWDGIVSNGEKLPCTLENIRALPLERRQKLFQLAQDNVEVKAKQQAESFPETADVR